MRSSSGCGPDDCGRTSAKYRPSTTLSPPSIRPSDARGRRSSAFVHEDSGRASGSALLVDHRRLIHPFTTAARRTTSKATMTALSRITTAPSQIMTRRSGLIPFVRRHRSRTSGPDQRFECENRQQEQTEARNTKPYLSRRTTCRLDLPKQIGPSMLPWLRHIMNEAIDRFRVQLGAAIDSVEFVKRALDRPAPETPHREGR